MSSTAFAVHCCQFYHPTVSAINCIAYDKKSKRIALSRADSCIEIWTIKEMPPCRERTFPYVANSSVEALSWCRGRLFATGLDGFLREWSLSALWPVNQIKVTPSAAWCMACNRTQTHLAVGTEAGAVLLISVTTDSVHVEKCLARTGDRVISIGWSPDGRTIVTGSVGDIRVWDVLSGRCLSRMTVGQSQADTKNLIWAVSITKDPIIVTGDSRGVTSFWDYRTSTLINEYQSHKADVLSVCWSEDRKLVFSSGIDPSICQYHLAEEQTTDQRQVLGDASSSTWATSSDVRLQYVEHIRLNLHTHDVRCLVAADQWLVSGGVDGVLTCSKYPPKVVHKCYPFNPDNVSVASKGNALLLQYPDSLELWRLGSTQAEISTEDGTILPIATDPVKLAQIKCSSDCRIFCSVVDDEGRIVAYSDGKRTLLYQIQENEEGVNDPVVVQPIKCLNAAIPSSTAMRFSSSTLLTAGENGLIQKVEIDDVICQMHSVLQLGSYVRKLACNPKKPHMAAVTMENKVAIIDYKKCEVIADFPPVESLIVDLKYGRSGSLLILCADGRLLRCGGSTGQSTGLATIACCEGEFSTSPLGFLVSSADDNNVIVYGDDKVVLLPNMKSKETKPSGGSSNRFRHVCSMEALEDGAMVVVQIDHERYLADLPPSLWVKKYGTG